MKNALKIAFRSLQKNRLFTALNMLGLSLGLAVFLGLSLFAYHELSYDSYHGNAKELYRVLVDVHYDNVEETYATVPSIIGPEMQEHIADILAYCRFMQNDFGETAFFEAEGRSFAEDKVFWADETIFELFDVPLLVGDPTTALAEPNTMVLGEAAAKRMFGNLNPVGKVIKLNNKKDIKITGVFQDFPSNSTLDAELLGSFATQQWTYKSPTWDNCSFETFLLLYPNAKPQDVIAQMTKIYHNTIAKENRYYELNLQALEDMHLHSSTISNPHPERTSDAKQARLIALLAIVVLLLACFNYINLTTAQSQLRSREVGISKTLGATRSALIGRFYMETALMVFIAMLLGIVVLFLGFPLLQNLTGTALDINNFLGWKFVVPILGIFILTTSLSGLYPALFLSSFSAKTLLNPLKTAHSGDTLFRKGLVVSQFVICSGLILGALIFKQQVSYLSDKELGFEPSYVVQVSGNAAPNLQSIKSLTAALRNAHYVASACLAQSFPGSETSGYMIASNASPERNAAIMVNYAGEDFDQVLGLDFLAGKAMPPKTQQDTTCEIVINETTAKFLGYKTPEDAIGQSDFDLFRWETRISGVVRDFHHESLHQDIKPYAFANGNALLYKPNLLVKMSSTNLMENIQALKALYTEHIPNAALNYVFVDEKIQQLYTNESRLQNIVMAFMCLAIFIAFLGLFGLAAFSAEQRTKEIGIRKVLGASVAGIVTLLSKDFVRLVLIAFLIATPFAYFFISKWLDSFAYRIAVHWSYFALSMLGVLGVVLISVGYQSVRAAIANPADAVRD